MKTFTHLWLDDKGLKAFNAPDKSDFVFSSFDSTSYNEALQQALAEGVYFKDNTNTILQYYIATKTDKFEFHKVYPVPDGYEVRVEQKYTLKDCEDLNRWIKIPDPKPKNFELGEAYLVREYAILVPKEKVMFEKDFPAKFNPLISSKQQSIEEAVKQYIKDLEMLLNTNQEIYHAKMGFIAGAKSQAAKEYWFEQFKKSSFKAGWKEGAFFMKEYGSLLGDDAKAINEQIKEDWYNYSEQFKQEQK